MEFNVEKTDIQLLEDSGEIYLNEGVLIEGNGLCAIYADGSFDFVCTQRIELNVMLTTQNLLMIEFEEEERLCSECGKSMQVGFYFESDCTQYCGEVCLTKVISWEEYLKIHDEGNGDAYWTDWYDS